MAEHDILAVREGDNALLLDVDGRNARVLDVEANRLYPPLFRESIIARGGWRPYRGAQDGAERAARAVAHSATG